MVPVIQRRDGKRSRNKSSDTEAKNRSVFSDLRDEIILEILIRLPSEAAVRCKAVCKRWYTLISDGDYFITRFIHHRHLLEAVSPFSLVLQTYRAYDYSPTMGRYNRVHIISENPFVSKLYKRGNVDMRFIPCVQRPFPFQLAPVGLLEFVLESSCADLLLCSFNQPATFRPVYYICNMVTKQWVDLPPIRTDSSAAKVGFLCDGVPLFQCNEAKTEFQFIARYKYRVVRIPIYSSSMCKVYSKLKIQIFSSEEGRWTKSVVRLPRKLRTFFGRSRLIACNRMLHMLTHDGIILLDPFRETQLVFRIIDLPHRFPIASGICLGTCQGQLRLSLMYTDGADPVLDVWDLEDYDNGNWCLACKISTESLTFQGGRLKKPPWYEIHSFQVLAFHPNNRNIVYLRIRDCVVQFDLRQDNKLEVLYRLKQFSIRYGTTLRWVNTFLLVHQWWPTPVPSLP